MRTVVITVQVDNDTWGDDWRDIQDAFDRAYPHQRMGTVKVVSRKVVFLCTHCFKEPSPRCSVLSGSEQNVPCEITE